MNDIYYPSAGGETSVHACIWRPDGDIKGVVQIIHGMSEYAARYAPFAEFLAVNGYLVCANDHQGHGQSVKSDEDLGWFNSARSTDAVLADIRALHLAVKEQVADKPYFIIGHSMGSFFCRKYISLYGAELKGAVIVGSGFKDKLTLNSALLFVRLNALFFGWRNRSKFIKNLAFGGYNKKFKPARTENDWLSKNNQNVDEYDADDRCGFMFTNNGYSVLFKIIKEACSAKTISAVPKDLSVYFIAGGDDPVGDYGKGVVKAKEKFVKAGVKDVSITLYDGHRHEILNDDCKDDVYKDVLNFINARTGDTND